MRYFDTTQTVTHIVPNNVNFKNGTVSKFFTVERNDINLIDDSPLTSIYTEYFLIPNYYYSIQEVILYDYVETDSANSDGTSNSSRRELQPYEPKSILMNLLFSFYMVAELGGLYTFLFITLSL